MASEETAGDGKDGTPGSVALNPAVPIRGIRMKFAVLAGLVEVGEVSNRDIVETVFNLADSLFGCTCQLVGGQFDLEIHFIIQEPESIVCMVELLDKCEPTCQAEVWSIFTAILKKSVRNLHGYLLVDMLGVLASYSITVKELKLFFSKLQGEKGQWAIALPPIAKWPYQNGFTFHTWLRMDPLNNINVDKDKPYLYCFRTSKGLGYSAHFVGGCLIVTSLKSKGKGFQHCVKYDFKPQKWYMVTLVHVYNRWKNSEISCYVNGELASFGDIAWFVNTSDIHLLSFYMFTSGLGMRVNITDFLSDINFRSRYCSRIVFQKLKFKVKGTFKYKAESDLLFAEHHKTLLYDGKLSSSIAFTYNPRATLAPQMPNSALNRPLRTMPPFSSTHPMHSCCRNSNPIERTKFCHDVKAVVTHSVQSGIHSIGGVQVLFPLFAQLDYCQPSSHELDTSVCCTLLSFVMELLKNSVAMQEQVLACKGFLVIGYTLEKSSKVHVTRPVLDIVLAFSRYLSNLQNGILLLKQLCDHILFNPAIWIHAPAKVQLTLYTYLATEFISTVTIYNTIRRVGTVLQVMHTLKYYYWIVNPQDRSGVIPKGTDGPRPNQKEILSLRAFLLLFVKQLIMKDHGVKEDELQSILNYLLTMHEDDNLMDVLQLLVALMSEHPGSMVQAFDQRNGIRVIYKLLASKSEGIRVQALKVMGYFLKHMSPKRKAEVMLSHGLFSLLTERLMLHSGQFSMTTYNVLFEILTEQICTQVIHKQHPDPDSTVKILNPQILKVIAALLKNSPPSPESMEVRRVFLSDMIKLFNNSRENRRSLLQCSVWQEWMLSLCFINPQNSEEQKITEMVYAIFRILLYHAIKYEWGGWRVWVDTLSITHSKGAQTDCLGDDRQMFLQVGTLTQQPSHSQPSQPPKVPLVHLCTQISVRTRRSSKERDRGVKVTFEQHKENLSRMFRQYQHQESAGSLGTVRTVSGASQSSETLEGVNGPPAEETAPSTIIELRVDELSQKSPGSASSSTITTSPLEAANERGHASITVSNILARAEEGEQKSFQGRLSDQAETDDTKTVEAVGGSATTSAINDAITTATDDEKSESEPNKGDSSNSMTEDSLNEADTELPVVSEQEVKTDQTSPETCLENSAVGGASIFNEDLVDVSSVSEQIHPSDADDSQEESSYASAATGEEGEGGKKEDEDKHEDDEGKKNDQEGDEIKRDEEKDEKQEVRTQETEENQVSVSESPPAETPESVTEPPKENDKDEQSSSITETSTADQQASDTTPPSTTQEVTAASDAISPGQASENTGTTEEETPSSPSESSGATSNTQRSADSVSKTKEIKIARLDVSNVALDTERLELKETSTTETSQGQPAAAGGSSGQQREGSTSAPRSTMFRIPEFRWSHMHQRLLTDLLFSIETDVQMWRSHSTKTILDFVNSSENVVFVHNSIHLISQVVDNLIMACGGILPLLSAATSSSVSPLIDRGSLTCFSASVNDFTDPSEKWVDVQFYYNPVKCSSRTGEHRTIPRLGNRGFCHLLTAPHQPRGRILIFASSLNFTEIEAEKNMSSGGILRQCLRLVCAMAVRNCLECQQAQFKTGTEGSACSYAAMPSAVLGTAKSASAQAMASSKSPVDAVTGGMSPVRDLDRLLQDMDINRLRAVVFRDIEDSKQAQFLALAVVYFISVLMVSKYRDILEPHNDKKHPQRSQSARSTDSGAISGGLEVENGVSLRRYDSGIGDDHTSTAASEADLSSSSVTHGPDAISEALSTLSSEVRPADSKGKNVKDILRSLVSHPADDIMVDPGLLPPAFLGNMGDAARDSSLQFRSFDRSVIVAPKKAGMTPSPGTSTPVPAATAASVSGATPIDSVAVVSSGDASQSTPADSAATGGQVPASASLPSVPPLSPVTQNTAPNMSISERLEHALEKAAPLLREIFVDFAPFLSRTLLGSHGQELLIEGTSLVCMKSSSSVVELVMLLCSQASLASISLLIPVLCFSSDLIYQTHLECSKSTAQSGQRAIRCLIFPPHYLVYLFHVHPIPERGQRNRREGISSRKYCYLSAIIDIVCVHLQEWQNSIQKNAGLAFIELVNEGRLLSHTMKDHLVRVANEAEFILSRQRAEDIHKHAEFESNCAQYAAEKRDEEKMCDHLIRAAKYRDHVTATQLIQKIVNILTDKHGAWGSSSIRGPCVIIGVGLKICEEPLARAAFKSRSHKPAEGVLAPGLLGGRFKAATSLHQEPLRIHSLRGYAQSCSRTRSVPSTKSLPVVCTPFLPHLVVAPVADINASEEDILKGKQSIRSQALGNQNSESETLLDGDDDTLSSLDEKDLENLTGKEMAHLLHPSYLSVTLPPPCPAVNLSTTAQLVAPAAVVKGTLSITASELYFEVDEEEPSFRAVDPKKTADPQVVVCSV
ncbi:hypothetical protein L3Q82_019858 [Scortum barcoo]|uniref:Uncharacterized protein n=1 Tax=Scortum barcoo TaxID=214431 RepID=A0ACB8VDJ3_9TELE|nr:hypothetical protein L3Q82_019858 [Scortum barcoo]